MTPILYEKDEIDFTSQGLGSLVEIYDVEVEEQRNGLLQLTASYPVSGARYDDISVGRIILAKPNQRDDVHAFRIVSTELDVSGYAVTIEADSITYDLTHNLVKHLNVSGNGQAFMTALKNAVVNPSIFAFYSDIATSSTTSLDYVNPMEAIMGTTGSFLQIWGGELKRENRRVAMFNSRGRDNVATFRLGKNISGLKYSVDISSLVTRIIPTKSVQNDDQTTTLEGTPVDSQYINNYEQIYTLPLEFTDDTIKTVADLNAAARGWFTQSANTGRDKPTVTIDIDVLSLQDSADYQDKFKNLESVSLTDTVTVYVPEYGVNVTAIVNELHYDPILDRVTKMTVGTAKQSFADSSRTQLSDLQDKIISVQNQADAAAVSANGKSTNYYGSVEPSHPQEGDQWYWQDGDESGIKQFINGDWMPLIDSNTQEKIAAAVDDAVSQAKSHTDEVKQGLSSDIATAKSQAASLASEAASQAYAYTDEVKQGLSSDISTAASQAASLANTAEANAKSAATSQFTQAQSALSSAKSDLTKSIASEASARNQAVAAANSQAQTYANQAKSDALNTIAKEVSDRQSAVSALDTKATNAVNQAKSDINDTIKALSVGGRNYFITSTAVSGYVDTDGTVHATSQTNADMMSDFIVVSQNDTWQLTGWGASGIAGNVVYAYYDSNKAFVTGSRVATPFPATTPSITIPITIPSGVAYIRVSSIHMDSNQGAKVKVEKGTKPTDWTPAPEDVVLDYTTKDNQIKATITQYQETNDGKVTKAQTDATTALGLVATKVSQTDYDTKTGDLTTKYTQVKQTTDSQATDIVNIKETATSQASKINSISSDVDGTKQSISDIETTQDSQSDKINQITTDVDGTKQSITDIQTKDGQQDTRMGTIETSVSGVKSDFSTYKTTNDGAVKTAQTTAQTAVDGLKTKVSQTDYNTKTGQLQTDLTATTQTANQAKTDIVSIKQKDSDQDAKMNSIVSDANGTKQTVSDLQTTQGKQTGDITTLQSRADGFDASVTKINNVVNGLGQTNQLMNTEFTPDLEAWSVNSTDYINYVGLNKSAVIKGSNVLNVKHSSTTGWGEFSQEIISFNASSVVSASLYARATVTGWNFAIDSYDANNTRTIIKQLTIPTTGTLLKIENVMIPTDAVELYFSIWGQNEGTAVISQPMLVFESTVGQYIQGNYNNNEALAKVKLTADQASLDLSTYTEDADGRIRKAQSDIEANATAITKKVSQTDYDKKTGDLSSKLNTTTDTADSTKQALSDYKEFANGNISGVSSDLTKLAGEVNLKLTKTDYDNDQSILNTSLSEWKADYDGWTGTVSKLSTTVNNLGQVNQLFNTEFTPDLQNWSASNSYITYAGINSSAIINGSNVINITHGSTSGWGRYSQQVANFVTGGVLSASVYARQTAGNWAFTIDSYNSAGTRTIVKQIAVTSTNTLLRIENVKIPSDTVALHFSFWGQTAGTLVISQPMLVFSSTVGTYVQGNYNNNAALAQVKVTADGISNFVRDSNGNLSSTFQNALSKTSIITGSTLASSIQTQTSSQIASALTDNNGKIISLINQDTSGVQIAGKNITLDGNTTFTALQQTVNSMGQINQLMNTEFNPDLEGWTLQADNGSKLPYRSYFQSDINATVVGFNTTSASASTGARLQQTVQLPSTPGSGHAVSMSWFAYTGQTDNYNNLWVRFYDNSNTKLVESYNNWADYNGNTPSGKNSWTVQNKWENITVPDTATYLIVSFEAREGTTAYLGHPMLVFGSTVGAYAAGTYNNNAALAQVKNTADGISNFVRDSNGNLSSTFQNALSKTSIITGSTLASSIQTQTSSQIASALTDNNGKIISLINQDTSGVQIVGKNIVLDGNTTVTGDFYAKGGNFKNLNASNLTVGTLNGSQVNITNINANNIVSGAISGANLNINLNTGSVVFQKGRINSSDYTTDINIDQGYISTANGVTRALLTQGKLQLIDPTFFSPQTNPYLEISNNSAGLNGMSALIKARDSLTVSINGYDDRGFDTPVSTETFVGLNIGKYNNNLMATKIGGAEQGVIISGGKQFTIEGYGDTPYIYVGSDSSGRSKNGDRVSIHASYFHSPSTYLRTTSGSANVVVNSDGALVRSSSARKYKLDIKNNIKIDDSLKLIEVPLSTWVDKHEHEENGSNERYFGMIAEDLRDAGLEYLVQYGEDNEVEGINYDRVALLLIPLVKELKEHIEELESEGK